MFLLFIIKLSKLKQVCSSEYKRKVHQPFYVFKLGALVELSEPSSKCFKIIKKKMIEF